MFTLGTTSWRVEQITHDQVLVSLLRAPRDGCRSGRVTRRAARANSAPSASSFASWAVLPAEPAAHRLRETGLDDAAGTSTTSKSSAARCATN